jgi:hypothetical protein
VGGAVLLALAACAEDEPVKVFGRGDGINGQDSVHTRSKSGELQLFTWVEEPLQAYWLGSAPEEGPVVYSQISSLFPGLSATTSVHVLGVKPGNRIHIQYLRQLPEGCSCREFAQPPFANGLARWSDPEVSTVDTRTLFVDKKWFVDGEASASTTLPVSLVKVLSCSDLDYEEVRGWVLLFPCPSSTVSEL